jgi:hypothetical protein
VPTPIGTAPPEPIDAYAASCPEQATVVDGNLGVVLVNCPNETVDCSSLKGGIIRAFLISPEMTWFMSFQVPRSYAGSITARNPGCSLQPIDSFWNQHAQAGWGGPLAACFYLGGCTQFDAVPLSPYVAVPVEWVTTDIYPQTAHNQLFGVLLGR